MHNILIIRASSLRFFMVSTLCTYLCRNLQLTNSVVASVVYSCPKINARFIFIVKLINVIKSKKKQFRVSKLKRYAIGQRIKFGGRSTNIHKKYGRHIVLTSKRNHSSSFLKSTGSLDPLETPNKTMKCQNRSSA